MFYSSIIKILHENSLSAFFVSVLLIAIWFYTREKLRKFNIDAEILKKKLNSGFNKTIQEYEDIYTKIIDKKRYLGYVDAVLTSFETSHGYAITKDLHKSGKEIKLSNFFNHTCFERSYLYSLIYPVLIYTLSWLFFGEESKVGNLTLLGEGSWLLRASVTILFFSSMFLLLAKPLGISNRNNKITLSVMLLSLLGFIFALSNQEALHQYSIAGPLAIAITLCVTATGAFFAIQNKIFQSKGMYCAGAISVLIPSTSIGIFTSISFSLSEKYISTDISNLAIILLITVCACMFSIFLMGILLLAFKLFKIRQVNVIGWLLWTAIIFCLSSSLFYLYPKMGLGIDGLYITLFFTVLPTINAIFDFVSVSFTRYFLTSLYTNKFSFTSYWVIGVFDVLLAIFLFISISSFGIIIIHTLSYINEISGGSGLGLQIEYFIDLFKSSNYKENLWIYIIFFTTLIPTILHLFFTVISFAFWDEGKARKYLQLIKEFKDDGEIKEHPGITEIVDPIRRNELCIKPFFAVIFLAIIYHLFLHEDSLHIYADTLAYLLSEQHLTFIFFNVMIHVGIAGLILYIGFNYLHPKLINKAMSEQ
jgi:hypothetical protein